MNETEKKDNIIEIEETERSASSAKDGKGGKHEKKPDKKTSVGRSAFRWVLDIAIAVVIAFLITLMIRPTVVRETSMMPNIEPGDYLLINRMAYKGDRTPQKGDVIVFKSDLTTEDGKKKLLIKRVIGVPGDEISIKGGEVYINGVEDDQSYTRDGYTSSYVEDFVVPEGCYFVMGDNRIVSLDSRNPEVGAVPEDRIVGKVFIRLFPFKRFGVLKNPYTDQN